MRLSKGNKVEVYSKKEVSSGSWSCAEIISGNGRTYSVRYSPMEEPVEKVPRWAIRPRPPSVNGTNVWAAGDLVEAFHNSSWKQAKIIKIVGVDCYIVRLLGSPLDVVVSQSNLRMRQAWLDGQWILLGKAFEDSRSLSRNRRTEADMVKSKDQQLVVRPPSRPRKRRLLGESKNHRVSVKKRKVAEKDVMCLPSLAKTNDMFLTQELSRVRLNTRDDVGLRKGNLIQGTSTHIHTDSCASSVGSNNSIDEFFKVPFISLAHRSEEVKDMDYCSDAESSTGWEHEEDDQCSSEEELANFHSLWRFVGENTGTSLVMTWNNLEALGASEESQAGISIQFFFEYAYRKPFDENKRLKFSIVDVLMKQAPQLDKVEKAVMAITCPHQTSKLK